MARACSRSSRPVCSPRRSPPYAPPASIRCERFGTTERSRRRRSPTGALGLLLPVAFEAVVGLIELDGEAVRTARQAAGSGGGSKRRQPRVVALRACR